MTGPDNRVNTQVQGLLHHQPSKLDVQSHSRKEQVLREIDNYFGKDWPFEGSEELKKIHDNDLTGMVCYAFPTAHDDRIFILVLFFIVVVLMDGVYIFPNGNIDNEMCYFNLHVNLCIDMLDDMSFKEGELFTERLISISRQEKDVNPSIPIEYLISDIWKRIREIDTEAIIPILQETFSVWKHQVVKDRNKWNSFSDYLDYRIHDGAGM
jgi:hypothetical protein